MDSLTILLDAFQELRERLYGRTVRHEELVKEFCEEAARLREENEEYRRVIAIIKAAMARMEQRGANHHDTQEVQP